MGLLDDTSPEAIMKELGYDDSYNPIIPEAPRSAMHYQNESVANAVEEVYEEQVEEEQEQVEESAIDIEFNKAERRLSKAILYRQLIKGRFFDGNEELVLEVEQELKEFVKRQYLVLSGAISTKAVEVTKVEVVRDFSDEEVTVLKALAGRVLSSPKMLAPKAVKETPVKPVVKPVVIAPPVVKAEPAKKPELKPRRVPEEAAQVKAKPALKAINKPVGKPATKPSVNLVQNLAVPQDESIIEENGKFYKVKHIDMLNPDEYGLMDGAAIKKMADNSSINISNHMQIGKVGGRTVKIIKTLVNKNQDVPGRVPFPSADQTYQITMAGALAASNNLPKQLLPPGISQILG